MNKKIPLGAALISLLPVLAYSPAVADVHGLWQTPPTEKGENIGAYLHVDLQPCETAAEWLCGVIVAAYDAQGREGDVPFIGRQMLINLKRKSTNQWSKGTIWAPDEDKKYRSKVKLVDESTLKVSGCIAGGLFCRGQLWTRP